MLSRNRGDENQRETMLKEDHGRSIHPHDSSDIPDRSDIGTYKKGNILVRGSELQWMYEFSFRRNPVILITLSRTMLRSVCIPALILFFITLRAGFSEALTVAGVIVGYGIPIMAGLFGIDYILKGVVNGRKHCVIFQMDDEGVYHIQLRRQYSREEAKRFLKALVGLTEGSLAVYGAGLVVATKKSRYTNFDKVVSIKAMPSINTIYLHELMTTNRLFVEDEDFDFVLEYILQHCPENSKVVPDKI